MLVKLNVAVDRLGDVLAVLPAMSSPTVTALASGDMRAVESVVPKRGVNTLIPALKAAGARDILELPISKIVDDRGAVGLAFTGGAVFALQTRVNGELGDRSGSPFWAALVSFGSGLVLLAVVVAAVPRLRAAAGRAVRDRLPWWTYVGGTAGATLVVVSAIAVPRVGVATFTVGVVAGQAVGGLVVDRLGLGPGGSQPLSGPRIAGAALAVVAVAVIRLEHGGAGVSGGVVLRCWSRPRSAARWPRPSRRSTAGSSGPPARPCWPRPSTSPPA